MKQIDLILQRITILFYFFVAIFIISFLYGAYAGFVNATSMEQSQHVFEGLSHVALVITTINSIVMIVASVWSIVLFVKMMISIWRSIRVKNIFSLRTAGIITRYAIVSAVMMVSMVVANYFGNNIFGQGESVAMMFNVQLIGIASSIVLMLIFAQVLRIGNILKQEQELTI